jgi:glutathione S-transferase
VPVYEEDGLALFESGAIVLHVAERCERLMPTEAHARARTKTWMFAALDSVGQIENLTELDLFCEGQDWAKQRRPMLVERVNSRLSSVARWLDNREYLEGGFTAADLLMTAVLRTIRHTSLVSDIPVLRDYQARCESRPAFQKALKDHLAPFANHKAN